MQWHIRALRIAERFMRWVLLIIRTRSSPMGRRGPSPPTDRTDGRREERAVYAASQKRAAAVTGGQSEREGKAQREENRLRARASQPRAA